MMAREELSAREIEALITQLDRRVDQLKQDYERYFIGVDRRPPTALHQQVVREVLQLDQLYISNTAQKFRSRSLIQRFNTLKTYWNRTLRQIEEGTYHRDRSRAERRQERREQWEEAREEAYELDLEADLLDLENVDLEEVFDAPKEPTPAPASGVEGMTDAEKERIKQARLAEIQRQLGLGGEAQPAPQPQLEPQPAPQSQPQAPQQQASTPQPEREPTNPREAKLAAMRERLQGRGGRSPSIPKATQERASTTGPVSAAGSTGGGFEKREDSRAAKLSRLRSKLKSDDEPQSGARTTGSQRVVSRSATASRPVSRGSRPVGGARGTGSHRVVQRSGGHDEDAARKVYNNFIEAKRRCNEPTDKLSYDAVKRSMDKQREQLRKKGSRNVDFQVVIKDGKAFLKPETKD